METTDSAHVDSKRTVTVLGTGIIGTGIAGSLLRAGHDVRVWNRRADKTIALVQAGAVAATDPSFAVAQADVVITALFDADAVRAVMSAALPGMDAPAVWVQTATIGAAASSECAARARQRGIGYLDAPVLGTKKPADEGQLVVLAAGEQDLRPRVQPVLDAIGSRTCWVSEQPGDGQRLKLAVNSWVLSITVATAQALALTRASGLDQQLFLDVIAGTAVDAPYAQLKGAAMINADLSPSFPVAGALKDAELIADALRENGVNSALMQALIARFQDAARAGHASDDMAAVIAGF